VKLLKYLLLFIVIVALAFVGIGWYISSQYGAIVKKLVVETINENLKSEVKVASIEVSTFDEIPYFSLVFNDVTILEPPQYQETPDTLFQIKNLSLQFDLLDIYQGNYQLKQVKISDGFGRFFVNKKGVENYSFWKSDTVESEESEFVFELKHVDVEGVRFSYIDQSKKTGVRTRVRDANVSGNFTAEALKLLVQGDFTTTSVNVGEVQYVNNRDLEVNTGIQIDTETDIITFLKGEVRFNRAFTLTASGNISGSNYRFDIGSKKIRLEQLNSLVPKQFSHYKTLYEGKGDVQLDVSIKGDYRTNSAPLIQTDFSLSNGEIIELKSNVSANQIELTGYYSNGTNRNSKSSELGLQNISASFPSGTIKGDVSIKDFNKMVMESNVSGKLDLSEFREFISAESIDMLDGLLHFDVQAKLILSRLTGDRVDITGSRLTGDLKFSEVTAQFQNSMNINQLEGEIIFDKRIARIVNVNGQVQSSNVKLSGEIQNALHWIFIRDSLNAQPLRIMATLEADKIDVMQFLPQQVESEGNETDQGLKFPFSELQISAKFGEFDWDRFHANNFNAKLFLSNGKMIMNPVSFSAMDGNFDGKLTLSRQRDNSFKLKLISNNYETNVQKMFFAFYNFGQNEITAKNINGTSTINVVLDGKLSDRLAILPQSIESNAKIKITEGQLVNYRSLKVVSDYFRKNLVLKNLFQADKLEESLMKVDFDALENEIYIKDQKVFLPRMSIGTSVLNLNIEGVHHFNGDIDYRLDFDISELLLNDKREKNNESVVDNESGGIRIFIRMHGPADDPIVEIDKERKKAYKKQKRSPEKVEFRSALNQEFGWFKKDTSLTRKTSSEEFEIEWEEADQDSVTTKKAPIDTAKKKNKKLKEIFKVDPDETDEFDFGDDDF
tara:strand:+ start:8043 stop:10727 length:2685 start_codon:yes stop_codon:yes gene_type:complete